MTVLVSRRLVEADPDKHLPLLAVSLYGLSTRMEELGRRTESLAACEEACAIERRVGSPESLARTLTALGARLAAVGRRDDAVTAAREAVEIHRRQPQGAPGTWSPHFAAALWGYAFVCTKAAMTDDRALSAVDEAIALYESVAPRGRRRFAWLYVNELRAAYLVRADVLEALGRVKEAAKLRRQLRWGMPSRR
jgi:tetratricopeptide (TPR) repeat protein